MKKILLMICTGILMLTRCSTVKPKNLNPVQNFQAQKYLGKWYEIARFDNSFEKGMTDVYAQYSLNRDGTIKVINSGIDPETGKRTYAEGKAKFVKSDDIGFLKVSFFGPFYGDYIIFKLDDYKYAYVSGPSINYLWLLSRTPTVPATVKEDFIAKAKDMGFDAQKLVWVKQS